MLQGGVTFVPPKLSHKDMEFQATRARVADSVRTVYRTSKTALGMTEDVNRATARVMKRQHWEGVLIPQATYAEDLLDSRLFTRPRTGDLTWGCFDFSTVEALREDLADRVDVAKGLATVGWTPRDINNRLELGGEEKPWWDTWYRPAKLVPVNAAETTPEPAPPAPPVPAPAEKLAQNAAPRKVQSLPDALRGVELWWPSDDEPEEQVTEQATEDAGPSLDNPTA